MYVDLVRVQTERKEELAAHTAVTGGAACSPELFRKIKAVLGVDQVKVRPFAQKFDYSQGDLVRLRFDRDDGRDLPVDAG